MYRPLSLIRTIAAAFLALVATAGSAQAQTNYFWQAPNGSDGTWNFSNVNWSTTAAGPVNTSWNDNSGAVTVNFGNTAGTVTLVDGPERNVAGVNFTASGYILNGQALGFLTTVTINTNANDATINSFIGGNVNSGFNKIGTGTLTLGANNTGFEGTITVSAGVLAISTANGLGGTFNSTTVANGAALQVSGAVTIPERLTLSGTGIAGAGALRKTGGDTTLMTGAITLNAATLITSDAGQLTIDGAVTGGNTNLTVGGAGITRFNGAIQIGSGQIIKDGAGTLRLNGNNNYTGATLVNTGILRVSSDNGLGATSGNTTIAAGAVIQVSGAITTPEPVVLNGTGISDGGALRKTGADVSTMTGAITINTATVRINSDDAGGTLAINGAVGMGANNLTVGGVGATTIGGVITGSGTLTKDGAGVLTVTGNNGASFTGPITVTGGVVSIPTSTALGITGLTTLNGGTLRHTGPTGALISTTRGIDLGASGGTIDISTTASEITYDGVVSGAGSLTKVGAGTLTLTGINTFSGGTAVNAGRLLVNGQVDPNSGTGTGAVTVNTGGTFGGTGRAAGAVTIAGGGTIHGGDANQVGTLTINGGLTLADNATVNAIVGIRVNDSAPVAAAAGSGGSTDGTAPNPTSNNFIHVTGGGLTANPATLHFNIDGTGTPVEYFQTYSYQIGTVVGANLTGLVINNQAQFTGTGFTHAFMDFSVTGNGENLYVNITPVPEPATVLGLAAGALGVGGLIRRRVVRRA
jgi:fibronectin-binding autotransporter adhesin